MNYVTLTLVALAGLLGDCAHVQIRHVTEGVCAISLPASWKREEVQGIDSRLVRYRGDGFLCEIEFGIHLGREKIEIEKLRQRYAQVGSSRPGESIIRVGQRLGEIMTDNGDQNVEYVGLRHDTLLYVPTEHGYVTVRIFYRDPSERSVALRILKSVTIQEELTRRVAH